VGDSTFANYCLPLAVTNILADSAGFWAYDNRESLLQQPLFADVTSNDESSSAGS